MEVLPVMLFLTSINDWSCQSSLTSCVPTSCHVVTALAEPRIVQSKSGLPILAKLDRRVEHVHTREHLLLLSPCVQKRLDNHSCRTFPPTLSLRRFCWQIHCKFEAFVGDTFHIITPRGDLSRDFFLEQNFCRATLLW